MALVADGLGHASVNKAEALLEEFRDIPLRSVRQADKAVLPMIREWHLREAEPADLGQGVQPNRRSDCVPAKPQDGMPGVRKARRPDGNSPDQQEGFARPRSTSQQRMGLRPSQEIPGIRLSRG